MFFWTIKEHKHTPPAADFVPDQSIGLAVVVLTIPFARITIEPAKKNRALSVVDPSHWKELPLALRMVPRVYSDSYHAHLKARVLLSRAGVGCSIVVATRGGDVRGH